MWNALSNPPCQEDVSEGQKGQNSLKLWDLHWHYQYCCYQNTGSPAWDATDDLCALTVDDAAACCGGLLLEQKFSHSQERDCTGNGGQGQGQGGTGHLSILRDHPSSVPGSS